MVHGQIAEDGAQNAGLDTTRELSVWPRSGSTHNVWMTFVRTEKILSFSECGWTAEHVGGFVEALPHFKSLKKLHLRRNNLSDEGAKTLATSLKAPVVVRHQSSCCWRGGRVCLDGCHNKFQTLMF